MPVRRESSVDLGVRLPGIRTWLRASYQAEVDRGDPRAWFIEDDPEAVAQLNASSHHVRQMRRAVGLLDGFGVVNVDDCHVTHYPSTEDIGWLRGYRGGIAVSVDDTISPSPPGVEIYP